MNIKKSITIILFFLVSGSIFSQKKSNTAASNVSIITKKFKVPYINNPSRKIWVYLPPDYENSSKKYPVIYMHDGQNLFSNDAAYSSEWEVDETLNSLYKKTGQGFIVVGIENAGEERINEYTPWKKDNPYNIPNIPEGGSGAHYIDLLVNVIKPYIDSEYRTKSNKSNTGLIGSSMGGLISFYGALENPDIFGKVGVLSPSFWFSNEIWDYAQEKGGLKNSRMYLLIGGKEPDFMISDTKKMKQHLLDNHFASKNITIKVEEKGKHEEPFWKKEFPIVIKWLFELN